MIFPKSTAYHPLLSYQNHLRYIALEGADGSGKTTQARRLVDKLNAHLEIGLCRDGSPNAIYTCQPTHGPIGSVIRDTLRGKTPIDDAALQLLFAADRTNAAANIRQHLEDGHHVVTDRCELSSAVYYAASAPQFRCELCGWAGDVESTTAHERVKRWTYDDRNEQRQLVVVDSYRHSDKCDLDLTDISERRFRQALGWNDQALHPSLIIIILATPKVSRERILGRGNVPDMFENEAVQRRANRIYERVANDRHRKSIRAFTRIVWVDGTGNEDDVASAIFDSADRYLHEFEDDDSLFSSNETWSVNDHVIPKTSGVVVFEVFCTEDDAALVDRPETKHRSAQWLLERYPDLKATVNALDDIPLGTAMRFEAGEQRSYFVRRCYERTY